MSVDVLRAVREEVRAALADPVTGFNAQLAALADSYSINPFTINWDTSSTKNYVEDEVTEIELEQRIHEFPAVMLYAPEAENTHEQKHRAFSGNVVVVFDAYLRLNWKDRQHSGNRVKSGTNFSNLGDAVIDAAFTAMDAKNLIRIGERLDKTPLETEAGGNVRRASITMLFRRHV